MTRPGKPIAAAALFFALAAQALANVSLTLLPGATVGVQIPAESRFTSLSDTRLELRLHGWIPPSSNSALFWNAGFRIELRSGGELCATDLIDPSSAYGGTMCADISGEPDVTMRVQRDTGAKALRLEVRSTDGAWQSAGYCGTKQNGGSERNGFPCPLDTAYPNYWAGSGGFGGQYTNARLAWVKWFSSVVPPGSGLMGEGSPADLADWRFEGDAANQATGGDSAKLGGVNFAAIEPGMAVAGSLYVPSPVMKPVCAAGAQQTFRAGFPASLDGSGSYAVDGGGLLTYSWTQVAGPSSVTWSGMAGAQPSVEGMEFGSYVFQLTVTDSGGRSSSCTVKHGAVESDDSGVVITHNDAVDALLGRIVRFGANPWPWYDDRNAAAARVQMNNLDTYYGAYWDPASPVYGGEAARAAWLYNAAPANYYDNVAGLYGLYYRSGIDDYLTAARTLADRFWASPMVNAGQTCDAWAGMSSCYPARSLSVMGLVLRALDGRADMWPGLGIVFDSYRTYYLDLADPQWGMWDTREMAYHLAVVSYCALFDVDATRRQSCKASIGASFSRIWTPARAADGSFPALYYKAGSWETGSAAVLSNGSRDVAGVATNWSAGMLQCGNAAGRLYPCKIWFTNNPAQKPASNAGGDPVAYTATFVDATHLMLDRPYEGASGAHGWVLPDANAGLLGYGSQPFITGILGAAFDLAAKAIADSDPANSALARDYNLGIAHWLRTRGYWAKTKGLYYGVGMVNCQTPIGDDDVFCTGSNTAAESRVLNAEAVRAVGAAYAYSGDPALADFADTLYSAMFSKPGAGGPNSDGVYIQALDDGNGWYMIGVPPAGQAPKYFGMFFGFNSLAAWPAYRAGAAQITTGATLSGAAAQTPMPMRPFDFVTDLEQAPDECAERAARRNTGSGGNSPGAGYQMRSGTSPGVKPRPICAVYTLR